MKTQDIDIPDYGKVVLKKMNFLEKCNYKGKFIEVKVNMVNGQPKEEKNINIGKMLFWNVVYSIKSLPKYPNFSELDDAKRADIVSYFGTGEGEPENLGEVLVEEATKFNPIANTDEIKKK